MFTWPVSGWPIGVEERVMADGAERSVLSRFGVVFTRDRRWLVLLLTLLTVSVVAAACDSSDDEERLAAQRFFRNFLVQENATAEADVRIQGLVDALPPDFPEPDGLELLGSAFTDTDETRTLVVGWQSATHADDLFEFYRAALDEDPWVVDRDPRVGGIDFLVFSDVDNPGFRGELRINQEGDVAVVVLIARQFLNADPSPSQSG
jgi:hypothetical protein